VRVLVLGGTIFLGRHAVEALRRRGHEVVLFTRGLHGVELFADLERITGDRSESLAALGDRSFDAVIDTSGYLPEAVRASARHFAGRANRYLFVSSVSAYETGLPGPIGEDAPEAELTAEMPRDPRGEAYGPLKVLCEREVRASFGSQRSIVVRPGLIVGPHDPSDRFTYWPRRVAEGGDVLAPEPPEAPVQFVDARDLAEWFVTMLESGAAGTYNATSPADQFTFECVLAACRDATQSDARFVWVDPAFLEAEGVGPWMELPLWIPASLGEPGFYDVDVRRALASGLSIRRLDETVRDVLAWLRERPPPEWKAGLAPERERALLSRWSLVHQVP
jgi:2'-hydroxyisoflavone reductase